ncbi:MAG: BMP family lipoprotein [Halanaerobiales bacterium]
MKKITSIILVLSFVLLFSFSLQAEEAGNYGLILATGGLGDQSFNDLTYEGMKQAEEELGITFDYVEPAEISDFEILQRDMASSEEYDLIVAVGFDQADALSFVAEEYPDQKFAIIDSVVDLPNVASFVSKEHEGSFLVGALTGLLKQEFDHEFLGDENVTGVIGGMDTPLIRKFVAGYMAGVKYVNPEMEVLTDYVGGWSDPTTAREIANTMNNRGADIIYHAAGGSGLGMFEAAEEHDFMAIGVNSNQNHIKPDHIVASMLKRVDTATFEAVKSVEDDEFESGEHPLGVEEEGVGYTLEESNIEVPDEIISEVEDLKEKIKSGELVIPDEIDKVEEFLSEN